MIREVLPGIVADLGCGPLGYMLREICKMPNSAAIGLDSCWEMLVESKQHTHECPVSYVLGDNRCLPFADRSIDTILSVNSFLPEYRAEIELIFEQVTRVLRPGGRLVALLPSFEMSLIARDKWGMPVHLDIENHREWDTSGWQCFYTLPDIERLAHRHGFRNHHVKQMAFSSPEEVDHLRKVYGERIRGVPVNLLFQSPLFEHLLIADC
jgi:ubiquinone/menaquinone biosynthesis C-methylase UbiE